MDTISTPQRMNYQQAPRCLQLGEQQQLLLTVQAGRLWLTREGEAEDRVLVVGEALRLFGPARLHLGAFDAAGVDFVQSLGMRMRLIISEPDSANNSTSGWKKKPAISSLPNHS